jgi:hypothetical protein
MNTPSPVPAPANVASTITLKTKLAREADRQRNREIGHLLKTASLHRPTINRSVPHARGR